jgi:hypothetical protein
MFYLQLSFVLFLALLVTVAFTAGGLGGRPWPGAVWFFLLLFFGTWALGIWLEPLGPSFWGAQLVPYIVAAGAISILLAAVPAARRGSSNSTGSAGPRRVAMKVTIWAFFWATIFLSAAAIVIHHLGTT